MISREFIEQLHCPYCGSRLHVECAEEHAGAITSGILRCACYRYPVIENIAVLRQRSGVADTRDPAVVCLEAGDTAGALRHAMASSPVEKTRTRRERITDLLGGRFGGTRTSPVNVPLSDALKLYRPPGYADYLFYRYANNSFLAAMPLLALLKEIKGAPARVLDLNCGLGHASFLMQALFPNLSVIATDHDFTNLHLASRYLVPQQTIRLCLDAELPLPFGDGFLDATLCMDGLHYVRSKRALIRELDRAVQPDGIWLFPHMHNAAANNPCAGIPLRADDYGECFSVLRWRMFDEAAIFGRFMQEQVLDLSACSSDQELHRAAAFSLVASRRADIWRSHELAPIFLNANSRLTVNPIYRAHKNGNGMRLQMVWPSTGLESECQAVKQFLPAECSIDASLWACLQSGSLTAAASPVVEDLIKSCVLVRLPDTYA
jgi:SAM-dependent methyltransferase